MFQTVTDKISILGISAVVAMKVEIILIDDSH